MRRVHLLAIPHTVTTRAWSHCAFTQKVRRLPLMLRPHGWHVTHYGVEGADVEADELVALMDQEEHKQLLGHDYEHGARFYGDDAVDNSPAYRQFNLYAREALRERVRPGDLILCPFGHAHGAAVRGLPELQQGVGAIESGIGYFDTMLPWRIYESYAVRHACMAKEGRYGVSRETADTARLEFVVPNAYEVDEWREGDGHDDYVAFLGRLTLGKGVPLVLDLARKRPDLVFRIAGQGDITAFGDVPDNVDVVGPLNESRAEFLGNARCIIAPSNFLEPFCGAVVEAALCGTPAVTTDFGAFAETVQQDVTGIRCTTTNDFLRALDDVALLDRRMVRARARNLYRLENVAPMYDHALAIASEAAAAGHFHALGW